MSNYYDQSPRVQSKLIVHRPVQPHPPVLDNTKGCMGILRPERWLVRVENILRHKVLIELFQFSKQYILFWSWLLNGLVPVYIIK